MQRRVVLFVVCCCLSGCSMESNPEPASVQQDDMSEVGDASNTRLEDANAKRRVTLDKDRMGRDAYSKLMELVPENRDIERYGPEYDKALWIGRALVKALEVAPREVRDRELSYFATRIGKGTPEQDFYWLESTGIFTMFRSHPWPASISVSLRSLQLDVAKVQVPYLLADKVAFDRYAHSFAWMGMVFTPRIVIFGNQNIRGRLRWLEKPDRFPRDSDGNPMPEYWWDAREALIVARLCDSEGDFSSWTAETVDRDFTAWHQRWKAARDNGLLRPGKLFGWRVDHSPNARQISILPHPMIPELPFENCRFRPMGHHDQQ